MKARALMGVLSILVATDTLAHGGGLDKNGCHTNRKTGDYHCHGASLSAAPAVPRRQTQPPPVVAAPRSALTDVSPAPAGSDPDVVLAMQYMLKSLGYFSETPTANVTEYLRASVSFFRAEQGLPGGEQIDATLLVQLAQTIAAAEANKR